MNISMRSLVVLAAAVAIGFAAGQLGGNDRAARRIIGLTLALVKPVSLKR